MSKRIEKLIKMIDEAVVIFDANDYAKTLRFVKSVKSTQKNFRNQFKVELNDLNSDLDSLTAKENLLKEDLKSIVVQSKRLREKIEDFEEDQRKNEISIASLQDKISSSQISVIQLEKQLAARSEEFSREIPYLKCLMQLYEKFNIRFQKTESAMKGYILMPQRRPMIEPFDVDNKSVSHFTHVNNIWNLLSYE